MNNKKYDLETKLKKVYNDCNSENSAFWWYNNCPIKPNTGSREDIELLHNKFMKCIHKTKEIKNKVIDNSNTQRQFILLTLPDINYQDNGYTDKEDCLNKIMEEYDESRLLFFKESKKLSDITSPYFTLRYWTLFKDENEGNATVKEVFGFFLKMVNSEWEFDPHSLKFVKKKINSKDE